MKNKKSRSIAMVFVLLMALPAMLNAMRVDERYLDPALIRAEVNGMGEYIKKFETYINTCEQYPDAAKLSDEQLNQCIGKLKELRRTLPGFVQHSEGAMAKIKNANKWTKELDEDFEKHAAKRGLDRSEISEVKSNGGFRQAYEKRLRSVRALDREFDNKMTELEARFSRRAFSGSFGFHKISFKAADCGLRCYYNIAKGMMFWWL